MSGSIAELRVDGDTIVWLAVDTSRFTGELFRAPVAGGASERLAVIDFGEPKSFEVTGDAYLVYSKPLGEKASCTECGLTRVEKSSPHAMKRIAGYAEIGDGPVFTIDGQDVLWYFGSSADLPAGIRTVPARGGAVKSLATFKAKSSSLMAAPQVTPDAIAWVHGGVMTRGLNSTKAGTLPAIEWIGKKGGAAKARDIDWRTDFRVVRGSAGDFVFAKQEPIEKPYAYFYEVFRMTLAGDRAPLGRIEGHLQDLADVDAKHVIAVTQAKGDNIDQRIVEVSPAGSTVLAEHQDGIGKFAAGPKSAAWVVYGKTPAIRAVER